MSFLGDSTLKITAIMLMALGATVALGRQSAAARHWVLSVSIICALAAPLLGFVAPWHPRFETFAPALGVERSGGAVPTSTLFEPASAETRSVSFDTPGTAVKSWSWRTLPGLLGAIWIVGAGINLLILGVGLTRLAWLASRAQRIERGRWAVLAHEISHTIGLRRAVLLLHSDHPALLVTWGLVRPNILLPAAALGWPDDRARIVLRHELAHVSRGDWAVQMSAEVLRAIYWFNPLVWIACRRLRQESEHACDDAVLSGGIDGADYATHLLDLARILNAERRVWLPAPAMVLRSSLEGRIHAMLNASLNRSPLTRSWRAAIVVALLGLAVPIAGAQSSFFTFSGVIVDQTNRMIPGASLVLSNTEHQSQYAVRSDSTGRFEFVGLPNGEYTLAVTENGFATTKDTVLIVGRDLSRTLELQVGSLQESVTISDRSGTSTAVPTEALQEIRQRAQERNQRALEKCSASPPGPVGGNILIPVKLHNVNPIYPDYLKNSKIEGVVIMEALIETDGTVSDVRVLRSPQPDLENAAVEAVRQWQYSSTLLNCTPIEVRMTVTMNFVVQP